MSQEICTKCFLNSESTLEQLSQWKQTLDIHVKNAFPKIRIKPKQLQVSKASILIDKRNKLANLDKGETEEAKLLDTQISKILAEEGISEAHLFQKYCDKNGVTDISAMWKLKKRLWPSKAPALHVAKMSHSGRLVSAPKELKRLLLKEYQLRLRPRPTHPSMKLLKVVRKKVIYIKMKAAIKKKSPPFSMTELDIVFEDIKSGKAKDPEGLARDIFKSSVIGSDLKQSMLMTCNRIKESGTVPDFMRNSIIATIPKKGRLSKTDLSSERGIFLVSVIRSICMRLAYNSKKNMVDSNMSHSNIGGRKEKK